MSEEVRGVRPIDPAAVRSGTEIAREWDSRVIRNGSFVYKVYDQNRGSEEAASPTTVDDLRLYQELLVEAQEVLTAEPVTGTAFFQVGDGGSREPFIFDFSILPIIAVDEIDGIPVAKASYVPGPHLGTLFGFEAMSSDLELPRGQADFYRLNAPELAKQMRQMEENGGKPSGDTNDNAVMKILNAAREVSATLNGKFDLSGIRLSVINMKPQVQPDTRTFPIVVTDLYNNLRGLK